MTEPTSQRGLYLDDLAVGQRFLSRRRTIEGPEIKAFARDFDPQPFHTDEEAAKATVFQGLAASGWHTAALTMRLLIEDGLPLAAGVVGVDARLQWPMPTRPGDTIEVASEILEIKPSRSRPDRGTVVVRSTTRNQHGETVQVLTSTVIVPRRPAV
jgi:acyl dehydratase